MSPLFTASSEDLKRLNAQESVDFFRKLLWAEARRINLTINKVHVSKDIDVADGGIDATVETSLYRRTKQAKESMEERGFSPYREK